MSHTYHFVCVSCGEVLDVGKIVDTTESGEGLPLQFGGWRDQVSSEWLSGPDLWTVLERWHILHRGHEVRLVSESFLERVDPEGQLQYYDSATEILNRDVKPLPDDEIDARKVPSDVVDRLRSHLEARRRS